MVLHFSCSAGLFICAIVPLGSIWVVAMALTRALMFVMVLLNLGFDVVVVTAKIEWVLLSTSTSPELKYLSVDQVCRTIPRQGCGWNNQCYIHMYLGVYNT